MVTNRKWAPFITLLLFCTTALSTTVIGGLSGPLPSHTPAALQAADQATPARSSPLPQLFVRADRCMACHNNLRSPQGEDVSIGASWRASMMANSARDPYWQAAVRREVLDHPSAQAAIEDECSKCHMPMARFQAHAGGGKGAVFLQPSHP